MAGAGPAGSWAAYRLARAGARVTVFDPSHPREKPCGGGLTGRALARIEEILPEISLRHVAAKRIRLSATATLARDPASDAVVPLPAFGLEPRSGLVIASRAELDRALLERALAAGARLVPERIVDATTTRSGVEVRTAGGRYRGGWLLGADGAVSLVRRRSFRPFRPSQLSIAAGFYARGSTSEDVFVAFCADPPGYSWSFPRADHSAVGICAQADSGASRAELLKLARAWIERSGVCRDATRHDPYGWIIPSLSAADLDAEMASRGRCLLLGDAAGLVDPITREGIHFALQSADLASAALASARPDPGADYAERIRDEIHPELRRAAERKAGFFRPAFLELMVRAARQSPRIGSVVADLVCGRQPHRGLRRRLACTLEWKVALEYLRL